MHILLTDDGKILINCKAGCDVYEILQSIGLDWQDVMPENPTHQRQKPQKQVLYASEALELLHFETQIVMAGARSILDGTMTMYDLERLEKAMQTIYKIYNLATP
jgi:hypothetical protein